MALLTPEDRARMAAAEPAKPVPGPVRRRANHPANGSPHGIVIRADGQEAADYYEPAAAPIDPATAAANLAKIGMR